MLSHSSLPFFLISGKESNVSSRVGVVLRDEVTEEGRDEMNAPSTLMVRGMPLKDMHFRATSRMSSAVWTGVEVDEEEATECRMVRDSGEFIVIVAAV